MNNSQDPEGELEQNEPFFNQKREYWAKRILAFLSVIVLTLVPFGIFTGTTLLNYHQSIYHYDKYADPPWELHLTHFTEEMLSLPRNSSLRCKGKLVLESLR
jgi:hypothetical protein